MGQLDGQARGRPHRGNDLDTRHRRLLNQLEARAAAQSQDSSPERQLSAQKGSANQFVDGVVTAYVLSHVEKRSGFVEQARGVKPTCVVEHRLPAPEAL